MEMDIADQVLLAAFLTAGVMGAVVHKTNFCTMGAVSDWVNIGDLGRMRAWALAIAVAIAGMLVFEAAGIVDPGAARPPYRSATFSWSRYLLGGLMFGVGMTLCSGCGNKTLVRIGGGNFKSVLVLLVAAIMAYLMTRTDFYAVLFHSWMAPIAIDLGARGFASQEIGELVAGATGMASPRTAHLAAGGALVLALLAFVARRDFLTSLNNVLGGIVVGAAVLVGWYVTGGPMGQEWIEAAEFMDEPPQGVAVQSYTFINPMADTLALGMSPTNPALVTFGVAALSGVITGSFLYAVFTGNFRIEWFASFRDFVRHMAGAVLIGTGGVLALGCTIGQGITGASTLALGSFLALGAIIIGAALAMKVEYYRMLYEGEAGWLAALVTALADLHLIPNRFRRLEAM